MEKKTTTKRQQSAVYRLRFVLIKRTYSFVDESRNTDNLKKKKNR